MAKLLLEANELAYIPPKHTQYIVQQINLQLFAGGHIALMGGNGAGKSTLLRMLAAQLWPSEGSIFWLYQGRMETSPILGRTVTALVSPALQMRYQKQAWQITGLDCILSGFGETIFACAPQEDKTQCAERVAEQLGCTSMLNKLFPTLSQGQQRILLLARAMVKKPNLLCLDEPSDGLDVEHRRLFFQALEELSQKTTMLIATHRPQHIPSWCGQILFLEAGHLVQKPRIYLEPVSPKK
ncbi:MAG: ATP-binding cassette domain-containing protein, partial [Desulfovibrio sp.]|nr:ATP-binding cassette domain-containing protein [Desulfovibrio sp.]